MTPKVKITEYKSVYVAFVDILGFKDLIERNDPEELTAIYRTFILNLVSGANTLWKTNPLKKFGGAEVKAILVSDSIIIWTTSDSRIAFYKMISTLGKLFFESMANGIPLRGYLSIGPLSVMGGKNPSAVYGKGLVKAYNKEGLQNWSGCSVDDECIKAFNRQTKVKSHKLYKSRRSLNLSFLDTFPVPLKTGKIEERWVVDWVNIFASGSGGLYFSGGFIVKAFEDHKKNVDDWKVQGIIDGTYAFWEQAARLYLDDEELEKLRTLDKLVTIGPVKSDRGQKIGVFHETK